MKPIPETVEAVDVLGEVVRGVDLLTALQSMAERVQHVVPDCVGLSIAWTDEGVTFTLVASDEEIAVLDAIQYLAGGPCVDAVEEDHGIHATREDLLDEQNWRIFARATAAVGVRSTITFPLSSHNVIVGSANLYGASDHAFQGHEEELALIVGGWAPGVVHNADLSFTTRRTAQGAPQRLRTDARIDRAIGYLAARLGLDAEAAYRRMQAAALRAGISMIQLAEALLKLRP